MDINLPWTSFPYLAFSAKSFSLLRQGLNVNPPDALSYDMPLWHNVLFKNAHFHTYSSPSLIRDGILTVGQLLEDDSYLNQIAATWRSVYMGTIGQLANQTFVFCEHSRQTPCDLSSLISDWQRGSALSVMSYLRDRERRQPDEVWKSLMSCGLPASDIDFIRKTLWRKQPVGDRLKSWRPDRLLCPLCQVPKTMSHMMLHCKFLHFAFPVIDQCFPPYVVGEKQISSVADLIEHHPAESLHLPPGQLGWAAMEANWAIRCKATREHTPFRFTSYFLKVYRRLLHRWQQSKTLAIRPEQLSAFLDLLMSLQRGDSGDRPQLEPTPPTPPPTKARLRAKRRLERKMRSLHKLIAHLDSIEDQGYILVFTDGSSERFEGLGYVGGYGVFSNLPVSLSAPVPIHMKQTINTAEFPAAMQALRLHANEPKVAICTDSEYVLKGAQGAARRWQARGWVGSAGPVSNIPLWKELLQHLDSTFQDMLWVKVPSHVNVEGNEQADTLANNGRLSNPLYPARKTPRVHAAGQRIKRTRQVATRSPPPREVSSPRPTVLNFEQCVDSSGTREETPDVFPDGEQVSDVWLELGLVEMPDSPRSEESTHSRRSSASTATILSDESEAPAPSFCERTTHAGGGGGVAPRRPAASTDPQGPKPPRRRPKPQPTEAGIGAPRPPAVTGTLPRASCVLRRYGRNT